jgi:hypothetical protein
MSGRARQAATRKSAVSSASLALERKGGSPQEMPIPAPSAAGNLVVDPRNLPEG